MSRRIVQSWLAVSALAALALAAAGLAGAGPAQAAANSVRIQPASASVAAGANTTVELAAEPPAVVPAQNPNEAPAGGLAYWIIKVHYNPAVVQVAQGLDQNANPAALCTPMSSPAGAGGGVNCDVTDEDPSNPEMDTVVSTGAVVFAGNRVGLTTDSILATVTFQGVGADACSDLTIEVDIFDDLRADDDPTPSNPAITNGRICIVGGSAWRWGDADCSNNVSIGDAQKITRNLIDVPVSQGEGCPQINGGVLANGTSRIWGDVDCSGAVTIGDAQKIARSLISLAITQTPPCPGVQDTVSVVIAVG
ncbi:MAG: hypothetical protein Q7T33_14470 [Dehalococcoidia bacterium]|nr:hypothetical protein [Dehalococcoidia bacterium]